MSCPVDDIEKCPHGTAGVRRNRLRRNGSSQALAQPRLPSALPHLPVAPCSDGHGGGSLQLARSAGGLGRCSVSPRARGKPVLPGKSQGSFPWRNVSTTQHQPLTRGRPSGRCLVLLCLRSCGRRCQSVLYRHISCFLASALSRDEYVSLPARGSARHRGFQRSRGFSSAGEHSLGR